MILIEEVSQKKIHGPQSQTNQIELGLIVNEQQQQQRNIRCTLRTLANDLQ